MPRLAAFLRAVNVGGRTVKMIDTFVRTRDEVAADSAFDADTKYAE